MRRLNKVFILGKRVRSYICVYGCRSMIRRIADLLHAKASSGFIGIARTFLGSSNIRTTVIRRSLEYDYILNDRISISMSGDCAKITWIIPEYGASSGGHRTIFRHISGLKKLGISSRVLILETGNYFSVEQAHKNLPKDIDLSDIEIEMAKTSSYLTRTIVLTSWHTAYWARSLADNPEYKLFYFIQDNESMFYPTGSMAVLANATYKMKYRHIYASEWLANTISCADTNSGSRNIVDLGVDISEFLIDGSSVERRRSRLLNNEWLEVGIYYRPVTKRRMDEHAYLLLEFIDQLGISIRLHFFGWEWSKPEWPNESKHHKCHGVLRHTDIKSLMDSLDCCILLGATNVSLMPLETISAGIPTFVNEGENNSCLLKDLPIYFSTVPDIGFNEIHASLKDRQLLINKMEQGLLRVELESWESRTKDFFRILMA